MSKWSEGVIIFTDELRALGIPENQVTIFLNSYGRGAFYNDSFVKNLDENKCFQLGTSTLTEIHNDILTRDENEIKGYRMMGKQTFKNFRKYKEWVKKNYIYEDEDYIPANEPMRYYVRVKFSASMWPYPVKKDVMYRTYKDIIDGPLPQYGEMLYIRDCHGQSWTWNKKIIDEIKVYPQLEKVKEEEEDGQ